MLVLLFTLDRGKNLDSDLTVLVRYASFPESHFSSRSINPLRKRGNKDFRVSKRPVLSYAIQFETPGRFVFTNTDYAISLFPH